MFAAIARCLLRMPFDRPNTFEQPSDNDVVFCHSEFLDGGGCHARTAESSL